MELAGLSFLDSQASGSLSFLEPKALLLRKPLTLNTNPLKVNNNRP